MVDGIVHRPSIFPVFISGETSDRVKSYKNGLSIIFVEFPIVINA
jgi:hypothetical protein